MRQDTPTPIDAVLIGRNEGARLVAALRALTAQVRSVVYVDSGSTDDSVAAAQAAGARVVCLDMSVPFSAARARNAGFDALDPQGYVLFIDGDCALDPGFLAPAIAHLDANPDTALVTGWRRETAPGDSLYNRLCDWEWHRPAGPIASCGGDILVRAKAWRQAGGQNPALIAGEDEEFCLRLGAAGWQMTRLPVTMTHHDAHMMRFGQWWARATRAGHAFAQIGTLFPDHWRAERRRTLVYALALPALTAGATATLGPAGLLPLLAYPYNLARSARALARDGVTDRRLALAGLLVLSKLPNMIGMARFWARRARGAHMTLIEYK